MRRYELETDELDLLDENISFAFILRGKFRTFLKIKKFLENSDARLIYMKRTTGRLYITDKNPFDEE